jgi:diguanylate cyclase (GGDEF)-like protein
VPVVESSGADGSATDAENGLRARRVVIALWSGLAVLAAAFAVLRTADPGNPVAFAASQLPLLAAVWLSVVGSRMAWRSADERVERRSWALFTFAWVMIATGVTYFAMYQLLVDSHGPPAFSVADALFGLGTLVLVAGLVSFSSRPEAPRVLKARWAVDAAGVSVVVFAAVHAVIQTATHTRPSALLHGVLDAVYVVVGISIVAAVVVNVVASRGRRRETWTWVLGLALGILGVVVMLSPLRLLLVRVEEVHFVEVLLGLAFVCSSYLVLIAGVLRAQSKASFHAHATRWDRMLLLGPGWEALGASTLLLVAIPVLGVTAFRGPQGTEHAIVNYTAMTLAGVAMVARTALDAVYAGRLRRRVGTDPLTGLADFRSLQGRLEEVVSSAERYGDSVSIVVLDLNDFGRVNTLYGREEGDRLMREAARSLSAVSGPDAVLGRLGSDEFAAIIMGADRAQGLLAGDRMRRALHGVLTSAGLPLSASAGVSSCPQDSVDPRELVMKAYSAQYWAKTHGKDRLVSYDPDRMKTLDHVARVTAAEESAELNMLLAIVIASESRHETTRFHSRNVAAMSVLVAERMGLPSGEVDDIEIAALLHDIGKTGVADVVLLKNEPRSRAEESLLRDHVTIGERIVAATRLRRVAPTIRAHHERWDGAGYPDGLSGKAIPRIGRIIAVCDAFEGMTSGRPDRRRFSHGAALQELDQNMGVAYDPDVVEALITVVAEHPTFGWAGKGGAEWIG